MQLSSDFAFIRMFTYFLVKKMDERAVKKKRRLLLIYPLPKMFTAETSRFSQHIPFTARRLARSSSCEISLGAVQYVSPWVHYHGRLPPR